MPTNLLCPALYRADLIPPDLRQSERRLASYFSRFGVKNRRSFYLKNACRSVKSAWACVHHDSSSNRLSAMVVDVMAWTLRQQDISPTGWPKQIGTILLYALTSSNSNRFSKSFHCQNQEKNCNNISLTIPPHIKCVATLPCEMSSVCRSVSLIAPLVTTPA